MKSTHRKYDTIIPWLYMNNKEYLLDLEFRRTIPRTTINDWKKLKPNDYYGFEYRDILFNALEIYELALENKKLKKLLRCFYVAWVKIRPNFIQSLRKNITTDFQLIETIQEINKQLSLDKALKIVGIQKYSFSYTLKKLMTCFGSPIRKCKKTFSSQITSDEEELIKELFQNPDLKHWPLVSKYYYALRNDMFKMGRSTFYKHVKKLGLYMRIRHNKSDDYHPIISKRPNEYWHVDTTYYNLIKNTPSVAIAFASDNFSRMITGFEISIHNESKNIVSVLKQTIQTILKYHPDHIEQVKLVNDGGRENNNQFVSDLLNGLKLPPIVQLIAKKTIRSSNSSIEAINKIYKNYLAFTRPQTLNELKIITEQFVYQYNHLRPHGSLNGQTPFEVYTLKENVDYSEDIRLARKERIQHNQQTACKLCG